MASTIYRPTPYPFLKWAGGKTRLLSILQNEYMPLFEDNEIETYIEPFVGGGTVFFDIVKKYHVKNIYLSDINPEIAIAYMVIKTEVEKLISQLSVMSDYYLSLNKDERKAYYYDRRSEYNTFDKTKPASTYDSTWVKRAALTIFLNKTCFNGLYRLNKKNHQFNVPIGDYKQPRILEEKNLIAISECLQSTNVKITSGDFSHILPYVNPKTFIYYDPPYRPVSKTSNFTSYFSAFKDEDQYRLAKVFRKAHRIGAFQLLSAPDPTALTEDPFFDNLYSDFNIKRVMAPRGISAKGESRKKIRELVVTSFA
ncbi:Dam family site-specific DNA-(adenine-N6)-methyltransferase [Moorena sp. SIO3B2]|uniref:Dam family site-specific DNA-(adenine-N6)-methyltransferase n=1 Tax=Moorena sp. SIO3B2 TaxID=2607827 RepID=UPI0013C8F9D0|nr:Dam family site-specific DNA-(adenine-N6)-methyltransferase [Moorena sp. SIO3B2]NEP33765.1 Dam family site-specific DNA-(adenine-N6)-methyltransferase [Moorena sp. SIO3B2]